MTEDDKAYEKALVKAACAAKRRKLTKEEYAAQALAKRLYYQSIFEASRLTRESKRRPSGEGLLL